MSEENSQNEEKEEKDDEKEENKEEKDEEKDEVKEENDNDKINIEDNATKEEKNEEKNIDNNESSKKDSSMNIFLQSKLKPTSEIKIDLKSNEGNIFLNKLNVSNQSILTAAFGNIHPPIPFIPYNNPPIPIKSSLKIITDINREMDLLSSKLNKNISPFKFNKEYTSFNNNFFGNNNYYNNSFDKENYEIKQLIKKVNELTNTNNYPNYFDKMAYNHNLNNNSKKYKNKRFHTINNYSQSSIDSKESNRFYNNNRHYQTLPVFKNNYNNENKKKYFLKNNNTNRMNHNANNKYIKKYINQSSEDSLYSNGNENEKIHRHSRNLSNRNYFINNKNRASISNNKNNNNLFFESHKRFGKRPLIYTQPESSYLNLRPKNKNYILNRDNYKNHKNRHYRFNTEYNDNRAINILMENE